MSHRLARNVIATSVGVAIAAVSMAAPKISAFPMFAESPMGGAVFVLELRNDSDTAESAIVSFAPPPQACGLMAFEKMSWLNKAGRPYEYDGSPGLIRLSAHSRAIWQLPLLLRYSELGAECQISYEFAVGDDKFDGAMSYGAPQPLNFTQSGGPVNLQYTYAVSENGNSRAILVNLLLKKTASAIGAGEKFRLDRKYLEDCPGKYISDDTMVAPEYRGDGANITSKNFYLLTTAIVSRQELDDSPKCNLILIVGDGRGKSEAINIPIGSTAVHYDRRFSAYPR